MIKGLIKVAGTWVLRTFDFLVKIFSGDQGIFSGKEIGIDTHLIPYKAVILDEYLRAQQQINLLNVKDFYKVETDIGQDENWKGLPLLIFNYPFEQNIMLCPKTSGIINKIPGCTSAMFSILGPGKHIKPHKGIYKGLYRCLFSLKVPENGLSWIRIEEQVYPFEDGKSIVFDETAEHEVKNESDQYRIVLYLDIFRPLPFPLNLFNHLIFNLLRRTYFITNIVKEYALLEQSRKRSFSGS